jgi:Domain of unknown function (DUF1835)
MIHFTNGDIVAEALAAGGVPGRIVACADPLHDGPCQPNLTRAEWRDMRARFLAGSHDAAIDRVLHDFEARDAAIDEAAEADEVVLWFEHDLFDQLNLIWLLDALSAAGTERDRVRLVVIGEHPDVEHFNGLGQLSPAQLLALFPERQALTAEGLEEARAAWADVCAPDPRPLARRAGSASARWPWLPGALRRLVEELPSVSDGLSRTERQGLEAIGAGAATLGEAFLACAAREERVFLGDWSFYAIVRRLQTATTPLIMASGAIDGAPGTRRSCAVTLTEFGRSVLSGRQDHARVNGLDRWVGGVHLLGHSPRWRVANEGGALKIVD